MTTMLIFSMTVICQKPIIVIPCTLASLTGARDADVSGTNEKINCHKCARNNVLN